MVAATGTGEAGAPENESKGDTSKLITPDRVVDTQKAVDVVREEVKGGESSSGGSPEDVLWQAPDPNLIKDRTSDRGHHPRGAATPHRLCPDSQPTDQG